MITGIKSQINKLIGSKETYPSVTKELKTYAENLNKDIWINFKGELDIIMPTFNRLSVTKRCIENLINYNKVKFNLIIVDNNSDLKMKKYLSSLVRKDIQVVFLHKNLGGSGSRMEGLKYSKSEFVAFIDNDILIMPYYLENLINSLQVNPDISAVQSKVVFPNRLVQINRPVFKEKDGWIEFFDKDINKNYLDSSSEVSEPIDWMPSGATIWRRSVFTEEGFDPDFNTSYEDNDFTFRLHNKGYKFMNSHKAICLHLSSEFTPSSVSQEYTKGRFGNENVMNSLKTFKEKHGLFLSFGDKEEFSKYMGFENSKKLEETLL
ncbi:MAG: glycosyltransferase family 2 protein [Candidatus Dojkabacteria bacterium]